MYLIEIYKQTNSQSFPRNAPVENLTPCCIVSFNSYLIIKHQILVCNESVGTYHVWQCNTNKITIRLVLTMLQKLSNYIANTGKTALVCKLIKYVWKISLIKLHCDNTNWLFLLKLRDTISHFSYKYCHKNSLIDD